MVIVTPIPPTRLDLEAISQLSWKIMLPTSPKVTVWTQSKGKTQYPKGMNLIQHTYISEQPNYPKGQSWGVGGTSGIYWTKSPIYPKGWSVTNNPYTMSRYLFDKGNRCTSNTPKVWSKLPMYKHMCFINIQPLHKCPKYPVMTKVSKLGWGCSGRTKYPTYPKVRSVTDDPSLISE